MASISGIVFDLDGTLVDSLSATFDAFNHGIELHGGHRHTPQELMKYFGTGEGQIFAKILGPEKADSAYEASRRYLDDNLHRVPLHEEVPQLLAELKSRAVPISICTGRSWNTTELILKHHGILDRFITVVANDHVGNPKPSSEGLLLALSRMKILPENAFFVGDSWVDIRAARSGGSHGVAAIWDLLVHKEELERHQPHYWAKTPLEILKFLE